MPTDRITDSTVEPVSLPEARVHLREPLEDADNDAYIASLITAARLDAEHKLQRTLITTSWRLTLDAFPSASTGYKDGLIRLPMGKVTSVESVKYVDEAGTLQTLAPEQYLVTLAGDVARIAPAYGLTWPAVRSQPDAVQVNYTAGYGSTAASVPAPIKAWIKLAVGDLYEQRSRSAEQRSGSPERPAVPMQFADGLLDGYKIWSL